MTGITTGTNEEGEKAGIVMPTVVSSLPGMTQMELIWIL